MSLSRPNNEVRNPAGRFFEWKGGDGELVFYDKEREENIKVPLPFGFIVLDVLRTAKGFDKELGGMWANEVRDYRDEMTVRNSEGPFATGTWLDLKRINGLKYTQSVYIAYKTSQGYELGNLQLRGVANGDWIEFTKSLAGPIDGKYFELSKGEKDKVGRVEFYHCKFKVDEAPDTMAEEAYRLDETLQTYLDQYLAKRVADTEADSECANHESDDPTPNFDESPGMFSEEDAEAIEASAFASLAAGAKLREKSESAGGEPGDDTPW